MIHGSIARRAGLCYNQVNRSNRESGHPLESLYQTGNILVAVSTGLAIDRQSACQEAQTCKKGGVTPTHMRESPLFKGLLSLISSSSSALLMLDVGGKAGRDARQKPLPLDTSKRPCSRTKGLGPARTDQWSNEAGLLHLRLHLRLHRFAISFSFLRHSSCRRSPGLPDTRPRQDPMSRDCKDKIKVKGEKKGRMRLYAVMCCHCLHNQSKSQTTRFGHSPRTSTPLAPRSSPDSCPFHHTSLFYPGRHLAAGYGMSLVD